MYTVTCRHCASVTKRDTLLGGQSLALTHVMVQRDHVVEVMDEYQIVQVVTWQGKLYKFDHVGRRHIGPVLRGGI